MRIRAPTLSATKSSPACDTATPDGHEKVAIVPMPSEKGANAESPDIVATVPLGVTDRTRPFPQSATMMLVADITARPEGELKVA